MYLLGFWFYLITFRNSILHQNLTNTKTASNIHNTSFLQYSSSFSFNLIGLYSLCLWVYMCIFVCLCLCVCMCVCVCVGMRRLWKVRKGEVFVLLLNQDNVTYESHSVLWFMFLRFLKLYLRFTEFFGYFNLICIKRGPFERSSSK